MEAQFYGLIWWGRIISYHTLASDTAGSSSFKLWAAFSNSGFSLLQWPHLKQSNIHDFNSIVNWSLLRIEHREISNETRDIIKWHIGTFVFSTNAIMTFMTLRLHIMTITLCQPPKNNWTILNFNLPRGIEHHKDIVQGGHLAVKIIVRENDDSFFTGMRDTDEPHGDKKEDRHRQSHFDVYPKK